MQQPWIPRQRDDNRPAVYQVNSEFVFGYAHIAHALTRLGFGNGHAKPPEVDRDIAPDIERSTETVSLKWGAEHR
jgi:hypothetical protein